MKARKPLLTPVSLFCLATISVCCALFQSELLYAGSDGYAKRLAARLVAKKVLRDTESSDVVSQTQMALTMQKAAQDMAFEYAARQEANIQSGKDQLFGSAGDPRTPLSPGPGLVGSVMVDAQIAGSRAGREAALEDAQRMEEGISKQKMLLNENRMKMARFWLERKFDYLGCRVLIEKHFPNFFHNSLGQVITAMGLDRQDAVSALSPSAEELAGGLRYATLVLEQAKRSLQAGNKREAWAYLEGVLVMTPAGSPFYKEAAQLKQKILPECKNEETERLWQQVSSIDDPAELAKNERLILRLRDMHPEDERVEKLLGKIDAYRNRETVAMYMAEAQKLLDAKLYEGAEEAVKNALQFEGNHQSVAKQLSQQIITLKNTKKIEEYLPKAIAAEDAGQWQQALNYSVSILALDRNHPEGKAINRRVKTAISNNSAQELFDRKVVEYNAKGFVEQWAPVAFRKVQGLVKAKDNLTITDSAYGEYLAKCQSRLDETYMEALASAVPAAPESSINRLAEFIFKRSKPGDEKMQGNLSEDSVALPPGVLQEGKTLFNTIVQQRPELWLVLAESQISMIDRPLERVLLRTCLAWSYHSRGESDKANQFLNFALQELSMVDDPVDLLQSALFAADVSIEIGNTAGLREAIKIATNTVGDHRLNPKPIWLGRLAGKALLGGWQDGTQQLLNAMMKYRSNQIDAMLQVMLSARSIDGMVYYASQSKNPLTPLYIVETAVASDDRSRYTEFRAAAEKLLDSRRNNRDLIYSVLVKADAHFGELKQASTLLPNIKQVNLRATALAAMAEEYARKGDFIQARNHLDQIEGQIFRIRSAVVVEARQAGQKPATPFERYKAMLNTSLSIKPPVCCLGATLAANNTSLRFSVRPPIYSTLNIYWGKYNKSKHGLAVRDHMPAPLTEKLDKRALVTALDGKAVATWADALAIILPLQPATPVTLSLQCKNCPPQLTLHTLPLTSDTPTNTNSRINHIEKYDDIQKTVEQIIASQIFQPILGDIPSGYNWGACQAAYAASEYKLFKSWLLKGGKKLHKSGYQETLPKPSKSLWEQFRMVAEHRPEVFFEKEGRQRSGTVGSAINIDKLAKKYTIDPRFSRLIRDECQ